MYAFSAAYLFENYKLLHANTPAPFILHTKLHIVIGTFPLIY